MKAFQKKSRRQQNLEIYQVNTLLIDFTAHEIDVKKRKCVDTLCQRVKNMHCISCSTFYRCSHRLFFQSMRKFPPTDVRFTQNRVFHLDRNLFLLSGGRPLETLGLCGKRLECAGKGASQVWCFCHCPCWDICAAYYVTIT